MVGGTNFAPTMQTSVKFCDFAELLSSIFVNKSLLNLANVLVLRAGVGLLLGIIGGGVPPGSPNPNPISDQKMPFSTLVFRPDL